MMLVFALNLFCFLSSTLSKLPQLVKYLREKHTRGLSPSSLILETISFSLTYSYFSANSYPVLDYLEYPALLLQNWTLLGCHVFFNGFKIKGSRMGVVIAYFLLLVMLSRAMFPLSVNAFFSSFAIPLSSLSKFAQIRSIYISKDGSNISRLPWAVYAVTGVARVITVAGETMDPLLMAQYSWSVISNSLVIITAELYTNRASKKNA